MIIMAIDPGLKGGVAIVRSFAEYGTWPMPVARYQYGSDRRKRGKMVENVDVATLHWMATMHHVDEIVVEQQTNMPGQSAVSGATTFANYGLLLSLRLVAPVNVVHPATWKAKLRVPSDKKKATQRCAELFEGQSTPQQDGPAEALMLGLYWMGVRLDETADQAELRRARACGKAKAVRGGFPPGATGAGGADGAVAGARPGRLDANRSPRRLRGANGRL
jgi:hypothetical protein